MDCRGMNANEHLVDNFFLTYLNRVQRETRGMNCEYAIYGSSLANTRPICKTLF